MKILTLNTHSLVETNAQWKRKETAAFIVKHMPDVIALQEVNQSKNAEKIANNVFPDTYIREDNYAYQLVKDLEALGHSYRYVYLPIKIGYGCYDEGLAILSKHPILQVEQVPLSEIRDYTNWKKRDALGVQICYQNEIFWFYSVHMGWWDDEVEAFLPQWQKLRKHLSQKAEKVYLAGDFNAPSHMEQQSYTTILKDGYYDTYQLAAHKVGHDTTLANIDGWKQSKGMRIDYIFINQKSSVLSSQVVLDGKNGPIVSDHYGILMEEL